MGHDRIEYFRGIANLIDFDLEMEDRIQRLICRAGFQGSEGVINEKIQRVHGTAHLVAAF